MWSRRVVPMLLGEKGREQRVLVLCWLVYCKYLLCWLEQMFHFFQICLNEIQTLFFKIFVNDCFGGPLAGAWTGFASDFPSQNGQGFEVLFLGGWWILQEIPRNTACFCIDKDKSRCHFFVWKVSFKKTRICLVQRSSKTFVATHLLQFSTDLWTQSEKIRKLLKREKPGTTVCSCFLLPNRFCRVCYIVDSVLSTTSSMFATIVAERRTWRSFQIWWH